MYSLSIDYLFNRIYDVLLWIRYTWFFTILRNDQQDYIDAHKGVDWDGLRDRGWFDDYLKAKDAVVPPAELHHPLWQRMLESMGLKLPDSDNDGIPDISDSSPYDSSNLTKAQLKERYQDDYNITDHLRDIFGIGPKDTDGDGVPNSYENSHNLDSNNPDSDRDGLSDGFELLKGTDPLNNDTDHDAVLDGRDESPLDGNITSIGPDSDSDGVSDKYEKILGTDIHNKDTDGDGIPDGMDTYPLDPNNISQLAPFDFSKNTESLHFSVQNPVLSLFTDFVSVLVIVFLVALIYVFMRWFILFLAALTHYEHFFEDGHGHGGHHAPVHTIKHHKEESMPAGIANLPIFEDTPSVIVTPTTQDFDDHPKFAVIQGYMSSTSEALWRIGIMEADNLLFESLREKGYQGDGLGEMLKSASFKTIDLAWDAHRLRNRIAHEGSNFELTEREAKRAFMLYESVLRELKVIR
jgi:hypothetical protein